MKFCTIFCNKEQLLFIIPMLTFRSWLQCGQATYTIHFRHSHSRKSGAVKYSEYYGQLSCHIVNKLCWKYLQNYVVAIYVALQNNNACMMCSYIYDLALYKISNVQQSSQSLVPNLDLKKNCVQPSIFLHSTKELPKLWVHIFRDILPQNRGMPFPPHEHECPPCRSYRL